MSSAKGYRYSVAMRHFVKYLSIVINLIFVPLVYAEQSLTVSPKASASSVTIVTDKPQGFCADVLQKLPRLKNGQCQKYKLIATSGRSVQKRSLYAFEARPASSSESSKLRILVIGGIHGDELSSPEVVLSWISRLGEADAKQHHWKFLPLVNPDGLLAAKPQRTNANGVDLNRNFPTPDWENKAKFYWEKQVAKDPRRYPGKAPLSEPESRWLQEQITSFKPEVIVSVHAPLGVLDFDGPAPAPRRMGRLYLDQVGVYPGSLGNYSGVQMGVPVVTLELPHALNLPTPFEQDRIWRDLLQWLNQRAKLVGTKQAPQG